METILLSQFPGAGIPGAIATWLGQSESQIHAANEVGGQIAGVEMALSSIPSRQPISVGPRSIGSTALDGINLNTKPEGVSYSGTVYRLENPSRVETTFDAHAGNIASDHRYSGPGVGSVYGATSPQTAFAEIDHYGLTIGRVSASQNVNLQNVLDLTNPHVRQQLNVSFDQITGNSYSVTHQLGNLARNNGYEGILAPSARNPNGSNLVIFPKANK